MHLNRENSGVSNRPLHLSSMAKYVRNFLTSILLYWNMLSWAWIPHQTFFGHVFVVTAPILMHLNRENSGESNRPLHLSSLAKYVRKFLTSILVYWNMLFWAWIPHQTFVGHVFVVTSSILMHLNGENSGVSNRPLHLSCTAKYVQNFLTSIVLYSNMLSWVWIPHQTIIDYVFVVTTSISRNLNRENSGVSNRPLHLCSTYSQICEFPHFHTWLLKHAFPSLDSSSKIFRSRICCHHLYLDALKWRKFWFEEPTLAFVLYGQICLEFPYFHTRVLEHLLSLDSSSNICSSHLYNHCLYFNTVKETCGLSKRPLHFFGISWFLFDGYTMALHGFYSPWQLCASISNVRKCFSSSFMYIEWFCSRFRFLEQVALSPWYFFIIAHILMQRKEVFSLQYCYVHF